jgi:dTDP-4-amino-4,6-dideoxygalactose transaminase
MIKASTIADTAIKLVDLSRQHEPLRSELLSTFDRILTRGRFVLGPEVASLEAAFAQLHDCNHAVGVSSGTDALTLALKALDVGPGDEVILPAMTFCATAEAACNLGARPVLVDVEPDTLGIDAVETEKAITERTKAIVPVHLHGWPVPLEPLLHMASSRGIALVEDCAQAHGAEEQGLPVGSRSQAGCFSFFPAKNLGALGDGGMVTTQDAALADRIHALANHGRHAKHSNAELGFNARLDELQAALLNVKLPYLLEWNEQRRQLAERYTDYLKATTLIVPRAKDPTRLPSFHLYVVRCEDLDERDRLAAHLKSSEIECGMHYPTPLHLQPALAFLGHQQGSFPVAELAAETMLSLPLFPGMREDEQDCVIETVLSFFN